MQQNQPVVPQGVVALTASMQVVQQPQVIQQPPVPQQQAFQQPPPRVVVHVRQQSNGPPVQVRVGALPPQPVVHQQPVQPVPQATLEPQGGVVNAMPQPVLTFVRPPSPSPSNTATQGDDDYDEQDLGQGSEPSSPVQMPPPPPETTTTPALEPMQVPFGVQCASPPPPQLYYPEPSLSLCPPPGYLLMQQQPLSSGPTALPVQQQPLMLSPQAPLLPFVPTTAPSPTAGSSGEWRLDQDGKYTFRPSSGSASSGSSAVSTRLPRPDELPPPLKRRMQLQQEAQRQISLLPDERSGGSSQGHPTQ